MCNVNLIRQKNFRRSSSHNRVYRSSSRACFSYNSRMFHPKHVKMQRIIEGIIMSLLLMVLLYYTWLVITTTEVFSSRIIQPTQIFILAGQSNMAGRGGVINRIWDGFVPPESHPSSSILRLNAKLNWEKAGEPLHADIDFNKTCGVGPGMVFANSVLRRSYEEVIGLVPCAVGGTSITEWSRGSRLYNDLIERARAASKDGGAIEAVLWYQGERDTVTQIAAESYKKKLAKLIQDLRDDLKMPKLLFIQMALASGEGPFIEKVREAQLTVDLPGVLTIDAKGLPLQPDGLHLSTPAHVRLGEILAEAFQESKEIFYYQ